MASEFYFEYRIIDGDRWDTIAHRFYGDAGLLPLLIADNGHLSTQLDLEAGEIVFIRQRAESEDEINKENLPPWRLNN